MAFKEEMLCSKTHEYVVKDGNKYVIGLTDYAVEQLGDIVFLELPEIDSEFGKGETFANIESVKAASEIYMPIGGKVVEVNEALVEAPETLNEDCYENGWLIKIESDSADADMEDLLSYTDYKEELE
ncbi:MAG: glycine cleavage system protein GcvH [Cyanobacteria bacterium SIG26]|nr:glycine cleavage system protein GcvH [Cyanobacteria bacterium SIG26]